MNTGSQKILLKQLNIFSNTVNAAIEIFAEWVLIVYHLLWVILIKILSVTKSNFNIFYFCLENLYFSPSIIAIEKQKLQKVKKLVCFGCELRKDGGINNKVALRFEKYVQLQENGEILGAGWFASVYNN